MILRLFIFFSLHCIILTNCLLSSVRFIDTLKNEIVIFSFGLVLYVFFCFPVSYLVKLTFGVYDFYKHVKRKKEGISSTHNDYVIILVRREMFYRFS